MEVNFCIIEKHDSIKPKCSIDELLKKFGQNIPDFMPLEGGNYDGPEYLFCVDANVDVHVICVENGYNCDYRKKIKIDPNMYNDKHRAALSYSGEEYFIIKEK
jgi:hypothetical protein